MDALSRRMSFKLPIVVRYNIGFSVLFGIIHAIYAGNGKWLTKYFYLMPLGMVGLCYEDIHKYLQIKGIISRPVVPSPEPVNSQTTPITK